ncbi:hypothetical protein Rhe02_73570 [Rhizocola hellebori]|uniref:LPXTG cell wall anchor domain-containing protein n=1 Tax=Rhizocola hellebori TaxID=1392758 RepID=A0A8J3QGH9_9ACTN|nr:hypothetical protein [Rhizocola hellebori]GIH09290.1 hypothetical protein Rhe02_73570 [Rhizocola hellebori]
MRSVLRATVLALGLAGAVAVPAAARADGEYLRITPSTIQAGFQVEIDAYCGDTVNPVTVSSDAFGVVTITPRQDPQTNKYYIRGTATVPSNTKAGAYKVTLKCPSQQGAVTTLNVVNYAVQSHGPHTGGGFLATSSTSGTPMIGAGAAVAGAGVLLFFVARRRRVQA